MAYEKNKFDTTTIDENQYIGTSKATHVGAHGDHTLGGAVGAAIGGLAGAAAAGAAAAGATTGAVTGVAAGPLGIAAGAVIGGVVGALVGKDIAQDINPTTEDAYWNDNYKNRPYVDKSAPYDTYRPAYKHGIDSYVKYEGRDFDDVETQLGEDWKKNAGSSGLLWDKAKPATRDAYERIYSRRSEITEEDINDNTGE